MSKKICKHCGGKEGEPQDGGKDRVRFYPDTEPFCFECHFWLGQFVADLTREGDRTVIVEDGGVLKHFVVAPEDDKSVMRGYGGHRFRILMNGAKVIETTNLWSQGEIPERFRGKYFRPNARILKEDERVEFVPTYSLADSLRIMAGKATMADCTPVETITMVVRDPNMN